MADDASNIITLRPPLRVVEQSSSGRFDFDTVPASPPAERVTITAGRTKVYAIRVDGRIVAEFTTQTNAARALEPFKAIVALGGFDFTLRQMLERSLNEDEPA